MASTINAELIDQFVAVTGAGRSVAVNLLEACAGNLDLAVGMHMDSAGGAGPSGAEGNIPRSSGAAESDDSVRAPIPQKTEVLVEEDNTKLAWRMKRPRRYTSSVFDGFRDFQSEAYHYEETSRDRKPSKKRNLEDLFRPPIDITYKGSFQNARDVGSARNKWLLVNVQNVQEFPCQLLNRDVWSNQDVRALIKDKFIFWQVYNDSEEGKRFMQFYKLEQWPYVAIIDPFTGENQVMWHKISDSQVFCDLAKDFLTTCPVPDNSQIPPAAKRQRREPSIVDATEKEQMEAAIQASLSENKAKTSSPQYVLDSDSEADLVDSDIETFSDSDEIILSSTPPNSSNGVVESSSTPPSSSILAPSPSSSVSAPSTSLSRKGTSNFKAERVKKLIPKPPSSSSSSSSSSSPSSQQFPAALSRGNVVRHTVNSSSDVRLSQREPQGASSNSNSTSDNNNIWSNLTQPGYDSPLEVNIENSLMDMIGGREAEVCTPDVCTLDGSPSSSQLSIHDGESERDPENTRVASCPKQSSHDSSAGAGNWKDYWGDTADPMSRLMFRFPNNKREQVELPCSSTLKALVVLCSSRGFPPETHELVTNYPRRKLSQLDGSTTLTEAGLHPQETIFVQDI